MSNDLFSVESQLMVRQVGGERVDFLTNSECFGCCGDSWLAAELDDGRGEGDFADAVGI